MKYLTKYYSIRSRSQSRFCCRLFFRNVLLTQSTGRMRVIGSLRYSETRGSVLDSPSLNIELLSLRAPDGHANGILLLSRGLFRPLQLPGVALNWSPHKLECCCIIADDRHFKRRLSRSFERQGLLSQLNVVNLHGVLLGWRIHDDRALAVSAFHVRDAHSTGQFVSALCNLQNDKLPSVGTGSFPSAHERL